MILAPPTVSLLTPILQALHKAISLGWYNTDTFNLSDYEYLDNPCNAGVTPLPFGLCKPAYAHGSFKFDTPSMHNAQRTKERHQRVNGFVPQTRGGIVPTRGVPVL